MLRARGTSGFTGNYFRWFNAPEAPWGWYYELYALLGRVTPTMVWMRLPSVLLGLASWFLIDRVVLPRLVNRPARWTRWATAALFLAWYVAFDVGLRPEPWIVFGSLAVFALVERALATGAVTPVAIGLAVAGCHRDDEPARDRGVPAVHRRGAPPRAAGAQARRPARARRDRGGRRRRCQRAPDGVLRPAADRGPGVDCCPAEDRTGSAVAGRNQPVCHPARPVGGRGRAEPPGAGAADAPGDGADRRAADLAPRSGTGRRACSPHGRHQCSLPGRARVHADEMDAPFRRAGRIRHGGHRDAGAHRRKGSAGLGVGTGGGAGFGRGDDVAGVVRAELVVDAVRLRRPLGRHCPDGQGSAAGGSRPLGRAGRRARRRGRRGLADREATGRGGAGAALAAEDELGDRRGGGRDGGGRSGRAGAGGEGALGHLLRRPVESGFAGPRRQRQSRKLLRRRGLAGRRAGHRGRCAPAVHPGLGGRVRDEHRVPAGRPAARAVRQRPGASGVEFLRRALPDRHVRERVVRPAHAAPGRRIRRRS